MSEKIQLVIVDDHPLFRDGVCNTLGAEADLEILGQGGDAVEALELAQSLLPDVILLDINMPGGGLNAAKAIAAACPVTKIVMLTVSEEEDDVLAALKAGARAYVLKGVPGRELVRVVRATHAGEVYVTPSLAASLLSEMATTSIAAAATAAPSAIGSAAAPSIPAAGPLSGLTEREQNILELLADGHSNKEIGQKLFLTEKTVKHYVTNILQKLQVRNRTEAALMAQKAGRVPLRS